MLLLFSESPILLRGAKEGCENNLIDPNILRKIKSRLRGDFDRSKVTAGQVWEIEFLRVNLAAMMKHLAPKTRVSIIEDDYVFENPNFKQGIPVDYACVVNGEPDFSTKQIVGPCSHYFILRRTYIKTVFDLNDTKEEVRMLSSWYHLSYVIRRFLRKTRGEKLKGQHFINSDPDVFGGALAEGLHISLEIAQNSNMDNQDRKLYLDACQAANFVVSKIGKEMLRKSIDTREVVGWIT